MNDNADNSIFQSEPRNPDQLYRIPQINLRKEAPKIKIIIADALAASTALQNSLMILPSNQNAMNAEECTSKFVQARAIRRKVLRYLQLVTEGEFLGGLLHANDQLVAALTKYDEMSWDNDNDEEQVMSEEDNFSSFEEDSGEHNDNYDYNDSDDYDIRYDKKTLDSSNPFGDQNEI